MFIVIEGADGAGKRTQAELIAKRFSRFGGQEVTVVSFPRYETPLGKAILRHLKGEVLLAEAGSTSRPRAPEDALALQCMMLADKYDAARTIVHTLQRGGVYVCDRWYQSALAYGVADGLSEDWLNSVHSRLPAPDISILIDLPLEDALARRPALRDRYEKDLKLQERVRDAYRIIWSTQREDPRWAVVNGRGTPDEVNDRIMTVIARRR